MSLKEAFIGYLDAYAEKDLEKVASQFADNIHLRDWKISVQGKQAAIAETQKNFEGAQSIEIEVLHTYSSGLTVAGELKITVDETEILYVVDVVEFDENEKIIAIRAFIGRES